MFSGSLLVSTFVYSHFRKRFLSIALACCASLPFWLAGGICVVESRAAVIPALESARESDFGSFQTTNRCDSGSGSFSLESLESLESAPLLEPIPTTKID